VGKADYVWIPFVAIIILVVVFWRQISGFFGGLSDSATNKEQYDKGKAVFYDNDRWLGEGSYKSCAMCHTSDWQVEPGKKVEMVDYKEGDPVILEDIATKYSAGMLGTTDQLYEQVMRCLSDPNRIYGGKVSVNAPYLQDLLEYVRKQ
jgi:hypothetical protein